VHLGPAPAEAETTLLALLDRAKTEAKSVVLNGDVFDFWFEWKHVMPRVGFRVLAAIAALRAAGVEVLWVAGNHDCWGGEILTRDVGVTYHVGPWRGTIGGWSTLIEHGDGLRDKEDAPYRRLRAVLRNPFAVWVFRWIHPDIATGIALRTSHTSRNMRPRDRGEGLRRVAIAKLAEDPGVQLYVYGHSHAPVVERAEGGGVLANPGAWMDGPTFLRIEPERIDLVQLDGAGTRIIERMERKAIGR
jgi:UDP-2,3-diacylglucosamine hydrolase